MSEFTKEQINAARMAGKALKQLSDSGLYLIWHSSTGNIYAIGEEDFDRPYPENALECGKIHDGGDW